MRRAQRRRDGRHGEGGHVLLHEAWPGGTTTAAFRTSALIRAFQKIVGEAVTEFRVRRNEHLSNG